MAVINGKTKIRIAPRFGVAAPLTRVCGRDFNRALRSGKLEDVLDSEGRKIVPSKGLTWEQVASLVRAGKSVQAKVA